MAVPLLLAQTVPTIPAVPGVPVAAAAPVPVPDESKPGSALDRQLLYQLLLGEFSASGGEPAAGISLILDAANKTNDAQLYQRAADLALQSRSGETALQAARAWKQAQPASAEANRYLLQILLALNRVAETVEPLKAVIDLAPEADRPVALAELPRPYARVTDKKLAASVVEQALASYLANPATAAPAWTTVGRLRLAAGDTAGALDAARRGQVADGRADGPLVLALELMDPKLPQAEALVQKYLQSGVAALPEVRMAYARNLLDAQRYAEASRQVQVVTRDKPDFADSWLVLGSLQLQDNQLGAAETSLQRYVQLTLQQPAQAERSRGLAQAYLLLAQIAEKRKDFAGAESWLSKIENPEVLVQTQSRRASILARQGKLAESRQLIRQLPERNSDDARIKLMAEIGLLREFKQYRAAYDLLAQAVAASPRETELIYEQAMMAEKIGSLAEMERLLRLTIEIKPDYHHAYNALGYSLADRGVRLPEAKKLIQKALEFAPADSFILDSLGWVEFRLGNRAESLRILEAAYKARPDAEIAAHFGEVLWTVGQRERALVIWKEGLLLNSDNETLQETLKRLRVKL